MTNRALYVPALVLLLLTVVLLVLGQLDSDHDSPPGPVATVDTPVAPAPELRPASPQSADVVESATDPEPGPVIAPPPETRTVHVVDGGTGEPISDAKLHATSTQLSVHAVGRGRFEIRGAPPAVGANVEATAPGHVSASHPLPAAGADALVIELVPKGRLSGSLLDAQGSPVEGALIRVLSDEVLTDAAGTFVFSELPHGRPLPISVVADAGALISTPRVQLTAEAPRAHVELRLADGFSQHVLVVDAEGRSLAGAAIAIQSVDGRPPFVLKDARTDVEGRCQVDGLRAGPYRLLASAEGYDQALVPLLHLGPDRGEQVARVVLTRAEHWVGGRVLDASGRPLAGVQLRLAGDPSVHSRSAPDGTFRIPKLARRGFSLDFPLPRDRDGESVVFNKSGFVEVVYRLRLDTEAEVYMAATASFRARIVDADGRPVAKPIVRYFPTVRESAGVVRGPKSDPYLVDGKIRVRAGAVRATGVMAGRGRLVVADASRVFQPTFLDVDLKAGVLKDLGTIRLERGGSITGTVSPRGRDVHGAVLLLDAEGHVVRRGAVRAGRFEVKHVPAGRYQLVLDAAGFASSPQAVDLAPRESVTLAMQAISLGSLRVRSAAEAHTARLEYDGPHHSTYAWRSIALGRDGRPNRQVRARPEPVVCQVGPDTDLRLRDLPPGRYRLVLDGEREDVLVDVEIHAGEETVLSLPRR